MNTTVFLLTRDPWTKMMVGDTLSRHGHRVVTVEEAMAVMEQMVCASGDMVITEIGSQGLSSLECFDKVALDVLRMSAIVIAAEDTPVRLLSEVIRQSTCQLIIKPFDESELLSCFARALAERPTLPAAPPLPGPAPAMSNIITQNPEFQRLLAMATRAARTDATILLTGETGTGKELLAREIHRISSRAHHPFVVVNCATLPETLLETELFGHARGAFTGASSAKPGYFEIAHGGTIFLDEIGDISPTFQLKLLRVLQQREYNRVGDTRTYRTDVRVLAATNQDLWQAVQQQRFRADLFYRLNVVHLTLPPLRQRKADIPALAHHFLRAASQRLSQPVTRIASSTLQWLERYDWPGNIRELQNVIERAVIVCEGDELRPDHLPEYLRQASETQSDQDLRLQTFDAPFKIAKEEVVGEFERRYILHHLSLNRGNVARTARTTGMFQGHLYQKIKRYQIDPNQFRVAE